MTNNNFLSFSGEMNTLISNFEQQNTITYEWLSKSAPAAPLRAGTLYDNGTPLDYTANILTDEERSLVGKSWKTDLISSVLFSRIPPTSSHKEFTYLTDEGEHYYVSYANIDTIGSLTAMILYSAEPVFHQLFLQRIRFLLIDLGAISYCFSSAGILRNKLLSPIPEGTGTAGSFDRGGLP